MRCFLAIDLPDDVLDTLVRVQNELPIGRLADPETFHVTLAFLGEIAQEEAELVHDALLTLPRSSVQINIHGLGLFGGRTPSVLYAEVLPDPGLMSLEKSIRTRLNGAGLQLERRRFHPHVTLARFKSGLPFEDGIRLGEFVSRHAAATFGAFKASELTFYQSFLGVGGATHERLEGYSLI